MKITLASLLFAPILASAAAINTNSLPLIDKIEQAFRDVHNRHQSLRTSAAAVVTTRNELKQFQGCKDIILIFARGTTEPGNVGDDVGPYFFDALEAAEPGRLLVQGVDNYKADIWGYLGGGSDSGATDMANSVALAASKCPGSKIVLSGFRYGSFPPLLDYHRC